MAQIESDKPAVLILNSAVLGRRRTLVRRFVVSQVQPYAQYDNSITILFAEPKKRNSKYVTVTPDNLAFYTIEQNGEIVYDSRSDIPLDKEEFTRYYDKHKAQWQAEKAADEAWEATHPGWKSVSMNDFSEEIIL